jgi:cellulose synthase (UDP-forming)
MHSRRPEEKSSIKRFTGKVRHALAPLSSHGRGDYYRLRVWVFRVIAVANLVLGCYYLTWRYAATLNVNALWFAIPLVLAETYSLIDAFLFVFMMWKPARRVAPPPIDGATVDVYIATYNEPVELIRLTAEAATRIRWSDIRVYILDDGARPAMEAMATELGCDYITRGGEWDDKPRHAKAGNVDNALLQTSGEFILILDGDQIPHPQIVERCIGYFGDPQVAFVQTPQYFYNLPPGDPFGSDAALFYGPIQQGKDGWNAAFFCGSNALLRREALMQLGLTDYAREMEQRIRRGLSEMERDLVRSRASAPSQRAALGSLKEALVKARQALKDGQTLETVSDMVRHAVAGAQQIAAERDLAAIARDLQAIAVNGDEAHAQVGQFIAEQLPSLSKEVAESVPTDPEHLGLSSQGVADLDLTRADEAIPILGLPTFSITEDMATAMRLHAMGWSSVFHPEILAYGLAPEDLGSALKQRLRWAQGTVQILVRDNPFLIKGLSLPQRLQYFTTMYSYFSGFANLIYLLAPIIYLFSGIAPISGWSSEFAWRLVPFLVINRLMFRYVAWGLSIWRGEQYSLALFPLWIQAVVSVITGAKVRFAVTPKQRQAGIYLHLIWPQLLIVCLTALAVGYGLLSCIAGWNPWTGAILVSIFWGCHNISRLWAIVRAAVYRPPAGWEARPPAFLFPNSGSVD